MDEHCGCLSVSREMDLVVENPVHGTISVDCCRCMAKYLAAADVAWTKRKMTMRIGRVIVVVGSLMVVDGDFVIIVWLLVSLQVNVVVVVARFMLFRRLRWP